jgi:hypothetical protein
MPWRRMGVDIYIHIFLVSAIAGCEWSASSPCRFTPGERAPGTHWIGGWVDPRAGLDNAEKRKFLILPGLELWAVGRPVTIPTALSRLFNFGSYQSSSIKKKVRRKMSGDNVQTSRWRVSSILNIIRYCDKEQIRSVGKASDMYCAGARLNFRSGHRLIRLAFFLMFFKPSRKSPEEYLRLSHLLYSQHSFQFIIQLPFDVITF